MMSGSEQGLECELVEAVDTGKSSLDVNSIADSLGEELKFREVVSM